MPQNQIAACAMSEFDYDSDWRRYGTRQRISLGARKHNARFRDDKLWVTDDGESSLNVHGSNPAMVDRSNSREVGRPLTSLSVACRVSCHKINIAACAMGRFDYDSDWRRYGKRKSRSLGAHENYPGFIGS